MKQIIPILAVGMLISITLTANAQTIPVDPFHKVIISPYIQATFVEGDKESVTINSTNVDSGKLHVEVHGGTLRIYLDGAKEIPKNEQHHHLYPDHAVIATVVYKKLDWLSLRGEETFLSQSPLSTKRFHLRVYGDSKVIFTEVHFFKMYTTIYGDGTLDLRAGDVHKQYYTCFGEGKINTTAITGQAAKLTTFGEAEFRVNVTHRIKITSFGEAKLRYMGNPDIVKGINFGGVNVQKLD